MEQALKTGKVGTLGAESRFTYGGVKWVALESRPNMVLALAEDVLKDKDGDARYMAFDTNGENDFAASSLRAFLQGDFMRELTAAGADEAAFVPIRLDLTSDDGLDDYGEDSVKIGLITDAMYRHFRKIIPDASEWWWTCTPLSTKRKGWGSFVRYVNTSGALYDSCAYSGHWGVRPLCCLKSDILVSFDESEIKERKPSFGEELAKMIADGLEEAISSEANAARSNDPAADQPDTKEGKRAEAVDMIKHIAAAFDIPVEIDDEDGNPEEAAKGLFKTYKALLDAGFEKPQAWEIFMHHIRSDA